MFVEDGLGYRPLGQSLAGLEGGGILWLVVVNVEAEDVSVLDCVGDGVGVELLLEEVLGSSKGGHVTLDLLDGRVVLEEFLPRTGFLFASKTNSGRRPITHHESHEVD